MMSMKTTNLTLALILFCLSVAHADIKLPRLISHGAILQRDQPVKIWGWADPGESIEARMGHSNYKTATADDGTWEITLPPFAAGGPYSLYLHGNNQLAIHNIYFGDVWLCSGQSNMELPVRRVMDLYEAEISAINNQYIRFFHIPTDFKFGTPETDLKQGEWKMLNPSTALQMSAVAYFFAQELYREHQVPQGFIINAVGGSPAEAWLSEETIKKYPMYSQAYQKYLHPDSIAKIRQNESVQQDAWHSQMHQHDRGIQEGWSQGSVPNDWKSIDFPTKWDASWFPEITPKSDKIIASVWFKKEIDLQDIPTDTMIRLNLGKIFDADDVYINGYPIGSTGYRYPPRIYRFNSRLLHSGKNIITLRIRSHGGNGEIVADKPHNMQIGNQIIDLHHGWKYQLGYYSPTAAPPTTTFHYQPSSLYNALLYPLKNLRLQGILWYQGESNTKDPQEYTHLFEDVIRDWRILFGQPDLPFLYVQLANYMKDGKNPGESNWAALRQVQLESLRIPNTGMVTTIDIGEWNDIHPLNKKDVGRRLALTAQKVVYGRELTPSGPLYHSHRMEGNKVFIYFDHVGKGLATKDDKPLKHFAIKGEDGKYIWANAKIEKDHIVVWHDSVSNPKAVRYAWGHNPVTANLINKDDLPASPFQTAN